MGEKIVAEQGQEFVVLPKDTVITVRVNNTKVETVPGRDNNDSWDKLDFEFTIVGVANDQFKDAEGQKIWGGVPFKLTVHPDNRLKQWTEALLGIEITEGFELDTDLLEGRTARAIVDQYPRKTGGFNHKVVALLPSTDPTQAQAQAAVGHPQPQPQPQLQEDVDVPF